MHSSRFLNTITMILVVFVMWGCAAGPQRNPIPEKLSDTTDFWEITHARYWGDEPPPFSQAWLNAPGAELEANYAGIMGRPHHYLALSGGGDNGAFGAGLLVGWTEAGTRPEFTIVSGVSAGAIIAPFAFLGPAYDAKLKAIYTQYSTKDLIKERGLLQLPNGDALADTAPLLALMRKYLDAEMLKAIAVEHRKGRELTVGTTNIDAGRPVTWNIGRIAASGHPRALELVHNLILASASIPVAFPPVYLEVESDGKVYDEMHVDGGVTNQVFLYPAGLDWHRVTQKIKVQGKPNFYLIRNARLQPDWETVKPRLAAIAGRTTSSLIRTQGIGDLFRLYTGAQRDGLEFHLAFIPEDFTERSKEPFDREYMVKLFNLAYLQAREGYAWKTMSPTAEVTNKP